MATAYYFLGEASSALQELEAACKIEPRRVDVAHSWGLGLYDIGELGRAAEAPALRHALERESLPTPAAWPAQEHVQTGRTLLTKKHASGAAAEFLVAMRLKPNYAQACHLLGEAYRHKGDLDEPMGFRPYPQYGAAQRNMGQAFEGTGNLEAAAQAYDRYLLFSSRGSRRERDGR